MTDGSFDNLTASNLAITGARVELIGVDGAGNHWILVGAGPEPDSNALGFNLQSKTVLVNSGWALASDGPLTVDLLTVSGGRTSLNGVDGAGNHWIRIGTGPEPDSVALGFNLQSKQVMVNAGWTARFGGLVESSIGFQFPDGSVQNTAQVRGPVGPQGPIGPVGPKGAPGFALPSHVYIGTDSGGGGFISTTGPNGNQTTHMSGVQGNPNSGAIAVTNGNGFAEAEMYVDVNGNGTIAASVKNFRLAHPVLTESDIVYACIEGPEVAAYVRGTAELVNGSCAIELPEHFAHVVDKERLTAQVTALSRDSLGLAVVEKSPKILRVQELQSGTGTYYFDWEIKGVRSAHTAYSPIQPRRRSLLPAAT